MKKLYLFVLSALVLFVYSCGGKQGNKTQQNLIVGKWTMQKQNVVVYVDGSKQSETPTSASDKTVAYIQFNKDGSYMAVSLFSSGGIGSLSSQFVTGADTTRGNYNFAGSDFSMSQPYVAALWDGSSNVTSTYGNGTISTSMKIVSQSEQVVQLTSSLLTLHTELTTTQTNQSGRTSTYKSVADFYYTK